MFISVHLWLNDSMRFQARIKLSSNGWKYPVIISGALLFIVINFIGSSHYASLVSTTRFLAMGLLVLLYLLVGVLCYLKNPEDSRTRAALLFFLSMAVYNSQLDSLSITDYSSQFKYYSTPHSIVEQIFLMANIIVRSLALGLLGMLPLYVPERKPILDRHPSILFLIFTPALVIAGLSLINYQFELHDLPIDTRRFKRIDLHLLHTLFIYILLVLLHTYRSVKSMLVRRQAKIMIYGIACWIVLSTIMVFAGKYYPDLFFNDPFYSNAVDALLPITVFVAVYLHRLFDIDVLIRKSLTYTLASSAMLVLYFSLVTAVSWTFAMLFGYEDSVITVALSTLIVGFGFAPMRRYSQRLIDRTFFREKYDYIELINQLLIDLTGKLELSSITEVLAERLYNGMRLKRLAVLINDDQSRYLVRCRRGDFSSDIEDRVILHSDSKIVSWLASHRVPLPARSLAGLGLSQGEEESASSLEAELFVPIALKGLVAILALGEKQSEAPFDEDDFGFLNTVGKQAAIVIENALLFELATYDGLTGLMRRNAFESVFGDEIRRCRRYNHPLSLLMLDIDHFKNINDTYGHQAGDLALKYVGRVIQENLRSTDTPSRYGGEEFCILLSETAPQAARKVAETLRNKIASMKIALGKESQINITVSIGVYSISDNYIPEADDILGQADAALYQAKEEGRNKVVQVSDQRDRDSEIKYSSR
jgi:diguanylate cyclase (GGDEF)-like protein